MSCPGGTGSRRGRSPVRKEAVPVTSEGAPRRLHFRAGAEAPTGAAGPGRQRCGGRGVLSAASARLTGPRGARPGRAALCRPPRQSGCLKFRPAPPVWRSFGTPHPHPRRRPPLPTWAAGAAGPPSCPGHAFAGGTAQAQAAAARGGLRARAADAGADNEGRDAVPGGA